MWANASPSSSAVVSSSGTLLRVAGLRLIESNTTNNNNNRKRGYNFRIVNNNNNTKNNYYNNKNNKSNHNKNTNFIRGVICAANALLLVAAFVIVSAFFADAQKRQQKALFPVASYNIAPATAGCLAWLRGACVASSGDKDDAVEEEAAYRYWRALTGTLALDEQRATGLFSEMNPLVICLVVQAITTALDLGQQFGASMQTRWLLQRMGLAVLLFFACLLLFMQSRWRIPQNNLLWLEGMLALAFGVLGVKHRLNFNEGTLTESQADNTDNNNEEDYNDAANSSSNYEALFAPAITTPMMGVAVLALAGLDDAAVLVLTYASLCGVSVLWLLERRMLLLLAAAHKQREDVEHTLKVLRLNMWLCITPFIIRASAQFYDMGQLPSAVRPQWVIAALALTLVWFLWDVIIFVVAHDDAEYAAAAAADDNNNDDDGDAQTPLQCALNAALIGMHYALYATVMLLVLLGVFLE